jgi:hypothetical protein
MQQTTIDDGADLTLAPPPDFRYVGLSPGASRRAGVWAGVLGIGTVVGASLYAGMGAPRALALASAALLAAAAVRRGQKLRAAAQQSLPPSFAIVPWGVLVESPERFSAVHWAGIDRVQTEVFYGHGVGTTTSRYSLVTIETSNERLVGRAAGAVSLERLLIHLNAYAREASHVVALDLDGHLAADGPTEPTCEPLLSAARAYIDSGTASGRLDLPARSYRRPGAHEGSPRAVEVLRRVLRDRTARGVDPRPFAAVIAAELRAIPLIDELVDLVQSPHPIVAAVAKVAACKLGVSMTRVGALEEVEPFLIKRDVEALAGWRAVS